MSRPPPPKRGDQVDDEGAGTSDLAVRAGQVAKRLLAEQGLVYLDDLNPDDCRTLLRAAWREAATQLFSGADLDLVEAEIDIMIDSLDMTPSPPPMPRSEMN